MRNTKKKEKKKEKTKKNKKKLKIGGTAVEKLITKFFKKDHKKMLMRNVLKD